LATLAGLLIIVIAVGLFMKSRFILNSASLPALLFSAKWHPSEGLFGFAPFIAGTVYVTLVAMVGIVSLFGVSYSILMPVFASDILHVGAKGLGLLMSSAGFGALIAALILARMGDFKCKGRVIMSASFVFSVSLILFSLSRSFIFSLVWLTLVGGSTVAAVSLVNTVLQMETPPQFRGRVMSAFLLTFAGIMPFGNLIAGFLSQVWGVSFAIMLSGLVCGLFAVIIYLSYPKLADV